jgi:protein-S-isoprenylcysteine O-methyltransferase Ste14
MTESAWRDIVLLSFCWIGYFALHSALASLAVKRRVAAGWPNLMPFYRLMFNILALLLLLPILWLTYHDPAPMLWRWQGIAAWLANGLALAAIFGFWLSLKSYDMQEFLGLRQLQFHVRKVEDQEHFHLSPFHRFVRHPWYFFGLVLIWTRDVSVMTLLSSVFLTLYFVVGSWLEERKLLVYHGDTYRRYMARVPGLIPLPWRFLTAEEAEALLKLNKDAEIKGTGSPWS